MKRLSLLKGLVLFLFLGLGFSAHSQVTEVYVSYLDDTVNTDCALPAKRSIFVIGNAWGGSQGDLVSVNANWGDGTDTTVQIPVNAAETYFGWMHHNYLTTGTYVVELKASLAGFADTNYTDPITLTQICAALSGQLYVDGNSNCIYDASEEVLDYRMVQITNTATNTVTYAMTDGDGNYAAGLPPGATYTIQPLPATGNLTASCPASGTATVSITSTSSLTRDFAYSCNSSGQVDLSVMAFADSWRPGYDRPLEIIAENTHSCTQAPATITVTLPAQLHYDHSSSWSPAPTVSGSTLTWNVSNFNGLNDFFAQVHLLCDTNATMGDTLCVTVQVSTTASDSNSANNTYVVCAPITNSFDPNDKNVSPRGISPAGNIVNNTNLTYLINFQNTGNDVAYNVVIRDTLDADLDLSTLKIISASHEVTPQILPGGVVHFRFADINLPDSNANEPGSHGFVSYSVKPKSGLSVGTQIKNTAFIYFDFNPPIVTNTVLNTIGLPTSVETVGDAAFGASIYPNPARETVTVQADASAHFTASIVDVTGHTLVSGKSLAGKTEMDVRALPAGIYLVVLTNEQGESRSARVAIRH